MVLTIAWVSPEANGNGGACEGGERIPITWTVENLEVGNLGSPGQPVNVSVAPDFGVTEFSPVPIPNRPNNDTDPSGATAQTNVPEDYEGAVTLTFDFEWSGSSGYDIHRDKSIVVNVVECEQPTTTVPPTTVPPTTVVTTVPTTEPPATTTVPVTEPPTTLPPTTEPPVTEPPTTEPPVTEPPSTEPPSTEPENPSTVPEVPEAPRETPPAPAQPVAPTFTG